MLRVALIAGGGALGTLLRYALQSWVQRSAGGSFPFGTLTVNVIGCLVIGGLTALFASPHLVREEYRLGLTVGILGGFTTFSAFGQETFVLAQTGHLRSAMTYVALSCGLGFLAVWIGYSLVHRWLGA